MPTGVYRRTEEHKEKLRLANKGRQVSEDTKRKLSEGRKGMKFSEEHKRNIGISSKGRIPSAETRKKISEAGKGRKQSIETRRKISESHKGEKCYLWKGGVNAINNTIRNGLEYRLWRTAVFERDDYTCIWCGARSGNGKKVVLNADHIKRFAHYPELRFAIDNGRTLCLPCHKTTENYGNKGNKII